MRIVYVSNSRIPTRKAHGAQITHMCSAFTDSGAEVELVVPRKRNFLGVDPFEYYRIEKNFSIRQIPIPDLGSMTSRFPRLMLFADLFAFSMALIFARVARRGDVVYCRDYPLLFLFSPRRNTIAIEVHDVPKTRGIFLRAIARARVVVAITEGVKGALVALGIDASRIVVAHDAVRLEDFSHPESKADARRRLGLPPDKKLALYIGRIDDWKGTDTFFVAAARLPANVRATVIGGEDGQVKALKKKHPNVLFLGARPYRELADNQAAADALVLPNTARFDISSKYTSPLKLFSYMASGIPIVASGVPSIREILDERAAYFVAPDDPPALAAGIERALADPGAPGKAARARAIVQGYTWRARARNIMERLRAPV